MTPAAKEAPMELTVDDIQTMRHRLLSLHELMPLTPLRIHALCDLALRSLQAARERNAQLPDFGDYVNIEQKRHGVPNEMFVYKVINRLQSNGWVDVPVQTPATETLHGECEEVVSCICCGVMETVVRKYRVADIQPSAHAQGKVAG